jgi:hypothetical protein
MQILCQWKWAVDSEQWTVAALTTAHCQQKKQNLIKGRQLFSPIDGLFFLGYRS